MSWVNRKEASYSEEGRVGLRRSETANRREVLRHLYLVK